MSEKEKKKIVIRDHVFDGIEEYDQKLPNWWLFTFYIMIVWFVIAWFAYYQSPLNIQTNFEEIDSRLALIEKKKAEELESMMGSLNNDSLLMMSNDPSHIEAGKVVFEAKCAACHGFDLSATQNGLQLPGVALNDAEWKYGSEPLQIMEIVTNGSPDITKGMIAWKGQLGPAEIAQVVSYILSHQP